MKENCTSSAISVASLHAPKLDVYSILQDDKVLHVWDAVLIRLLSQFFRVPYKLFIPPDGEWGKKLPDGNWTGIMGMVSRAEVDLAVGGILLTEERFQAVNFSYPYLFSDTTFMTDKPKPLSTNLVFLYPFSLIVWILIMVTLSFVTFIVFILAFRKETLHNIPFKIFGSLFGQSIRFKVQKISLGLLFSTLLIFIFVITNSYKGLLLSFLSFPPVSGIRNIRDLAKAAELNSITCYTYKGSALNEILLKSEFVVWRSIGKCLERNVNSSGQPEEFFMKAAPNKAFFSGKLMVKRYEKNYFISEDSFFKVMYALLISKRFCYKKELNKVIHRLFATGLFSKHSNDAELLYGLHMRSLDSSEAYTPRKLSIDDLKGAFLMLICGYILASITLFVEIVVKYYF